MPDKLCMDPNLSSSWRVTLQQQKHRRLRRPIRVASPSQGLAGPSRGKPHRDGKRATSPTHTVLEMFATVTDLTYLRPLVI